MFCSFTLGCNGDDAKDDALVDADNDGVEASVDCDDNNPSVYPGADEVCDGLDNDCNDAVDDNALDAITVYRDADGDGYGDPAAADVACSESVEYVIDIRIVMMFAAT